MSTYNHTPLATSTRVAATGALFNTVFGTLDAAIGNLTSLTTTDKSSLVAALVELKNSVDIVGAAASGIVATTVNGLLSDGANSIVVDDASGFVEDAYIVYPDANGSGPRYSEISSVNLATSTLFLKNATEVDIDDGALVAMITIDQVLAAGNYDTMPDRIEGGDALPGVARLGNGISASNATATFRQATGIAIGTHILLSPYTSQCEVRRVTAMSSRTATIAAVAYTHAKDSAVILTHNAEFAVEYFGAVYGSGVSAGQKTANLLALHRALLQVVALGGGTIVINGKLYIDNTFDITDLDECKVSFVGRANILDGAAIFFDGTDGTDYAVTLQGTSWFRFENLTINGRNKAKYGLFCGRNLAGDTAGKHQFTNLRVSDCKIASYYNYASEETTHIKCQFSRSPIGAIITGYPVVAAPETPESEPVDYTETYQSSIAHHFYDCAFGDSTLTTRAALIAQGSEVNLYGGVLQTVDEAEAYCIIDATRYQCTIDRVTCDGNSADIGFKIGAFTAAETPATTWHNTVNLKNCHITINGTSGTAFVSAYGLRQSLFDTLSFNGPASGAVGIDLLNSGCRGNLFINCVLNDNADLAINDSAAAGSNIAISNGKIRFLSGSASGGVDPYFNFDTSTVGRLLLNGGLYILPGAGINPLTAKKSGESYQRFHMTEDGIMVFADGSSSTGQATWYRRGSNLIGCSDDDTIQAGDGTYNGGHFRLGNYRVWVDTNGVLRILGSAPGSATAGKFVGQVWDNGATGARPGSPVAGQTFFDTTLGKPIWYSGANWVDATGATV